jgi:tight adherence protein C
MEYILKLLSPLTDDPEQARQFFILTIGGAVFIVVLAFMFLVRDLSNPSQRRLRQIAGPQETPEWSWTRWERVLQSLSPYILPREDWERSKASMKLVHAGFRAPSALNFFYGIKILGTVLFFLLILMTAPLLPSFFHDNVWYLAAVMGLVGLLLPDFVVNRLIARRQRLLFHALPDAIDLLVVCTEAGLGLNAALQRVGEELSISHRELATELVLVNAELHAGLDRSQALKNLAKRTNLKDIQGLVAALSQSMRFGTSIADTLRIYSEEFRDKRMQKAEEAAAKIGTKMLFPTVFCIFPAFFVVTIGPAIMRILAAFAER